LAKKIFTDLDLQTNKVTNLATPSVSTDAATKGYVDSVSGGGSKPSIATLTYPGTLTVGVGISRFYMPVAGTITKIIASVGTAPTGLPIIIDILKNGTTIYSTNPGNRPTIAVSTNVVFPTNPDTTAFAANDYFTVQIVQVGTTTAGTDAVIQIVF